MVHSYFVSLITSKLQIYFVPNWIQDMWESLFLIWNRQLFPLIYFWKWCASVCDLGSVSMFWWGFIWSCPQGPVWIFVNQVQVTRFTCNVNNGCCIWIILLPVSESCFANFHDHLWETESQVNRFTGKLSAGQNSSKCPNMARRYAH